MRRILFFFALFLSASISNAQEHTPWREVDRKYLLSNLARTRDELVLETTHLTKEQSNFKESPERWSINEVVEHLMRYEIVFDHEISSALAAGMQPARMKTATADSTFFNYIMESKQHHSLDYTKPFSFTVPLGLYDTQSNLTAFVKMRNESLDFLKTTKDDLRAYFCSYGSIHQIYIYVWGHVDRHLRQIQKIKADPGYPK